MKSEDVVAVTQIVLSSFTAPDAKDFDAYRDLHAELVEVDFGGVNDTASDDGPAGGRISRNDLRDSAAATIGPVAVTQHMISSVVASIDGDDAVVTFYEQALHVHPALGEGPEVNTWTIFGKGTHHLHRQPDGWKITSVRLRPTHATGNPSFLADVAALVA
ncbi:hypothetical protein GCM10025867_19680 [Frondihabitans sucicola]|uniref:SnoaL-like domain-containing protein n=1 Tax=Frondihabitans sucicola TaxID=1268041 RepID=A0ABM8GMT5_9MICO|nr:nuclear transport factor 2 family protein [Frondihabitans sucicola]BDZ49727.1 hypothetical protein GCM10025867_19680 [Frondihabitans sucicola]